MGVGREVGISRCYNSIGLNIFKSKFVIYSFVVNGLDNGSKWFR